MMNPLSVFHRPLKGNESGFTPQKSTKWDTNITYNINNSFINALSSNCSQLYISKRKTIYSWCILYLGHVWGNENEWITMNPIDNIYFNALSL